MSDVDNIANFMVPADPLRAAFESVSGASDPRDKLEALKRAATDLATPIRHGLLDYYEIEGRLIDLADSHGLIDELTPGAVEAVIVNALKTPALSEKPAERTKGHAAEVADAPLPTGPDDYGARNGEQRAARPPGRFLPVAIDDVEASAGPAWLIHRLLPARGLACIIGPPKSGKSFLTTDMLFSVARGAPYAGRAVLQGPVIYLSGEGVSGFKRRLVALRRHYGVEGQGVPFFMIENVPDLGSEKTDVGDLLRDVDAFISARNLPAPRAIAFDTLARGMGEGDENSARDMGRYVNRCGIIERHYGCVVPVVHHMGKNTAAGGRGSNALNGAADVTMTVEKGATHSTVRIDEMKDGPEGQEWHFRLAPYDLGETSATTETSTETSTCAVELLSEPTQMKPRETNVAKPPRGVTGDLLLVIRRAASEMGEANVASAAVPNNVRAVSRTNLKNYCTTMDWQDPAGKPDAFRSMLSKNLSALRSSGLIGYDREWVWLT